MSEALRCSGVGAAPGGRPVLHGVDLEIPSGSRTALVGPSGAGKTTLLRVIAGLEAATSGTVSLGSRPLDPLPVHRRPIAVVFQEPRLLPHLDVADNVALPLRVSGVGRTERRGRAEALLGEVGLEHLAAREVAGLSGGEQQRVALARALCAGPELLLLDEPLAAVDPNLRDDLRRLVVRVQEERGLTALIITHDRGEAAELGERVAVMLDGRIVQHDEARAVFERPVSEAVARFLGAGNVLRGTVRDGALEVAGVALAVEGPDGVAAFVIRPEHVRIGSGGAFAARVLDTAYTGSHVRVSLDAGGQALEALVEPGTAPAAGTTVRVDLPEGRLWRLADAGA